LLTAFSLTWLAGCVQPVDKIVESVFDASAPAASTEVVLDRAHVPAGAKLIAQFAATSNQRTQMFQRAKEIGATHVMFEEESTVVPGTPSQRITINNGYGYGAGGGFAAGMQAGQDAFAAGAAGPRRFYNLTAYAFRVSP
jgi:hypothetical protein